MKVGIGSVRFSKGCWVFLLVLSRLRHPIYGFPGSFFMSWVYLKNTLL
jgi:hypothetical protein